MIVPLLVSAIRIETNPDKFSLGTNQAAIRLPEATKSFSKSELKSININDQDSHVRNEESEKHTNYIAEEDSKIRRGRTSSINKHSKTNSKILAQKLANEALKSLKMQETMKKLTHIKTPKNSLQRPMKLPVSKHARNKSMKMYDKSASRKGRRKKKRKRHHRRFGTHKPRWPKRGPSKKPHNIRRDITMIKPGPENERSIFKNNQEIPTDKTQNPEKDNDKINVIKYQENDYVDFSSPLNTQPSPFPTTTSQRLIKHPHESMIERLMKTTSKDPSKKHPVDQGIEYSDYYNDDDLLEDVVPNKIQIKFADSENPNDRVIRQTINNTVYNNPLINNVQSDFQDFNNYDDSNSLNFPNAINNQPLEFDQNSQLGINEDSKFNQIPNYESDSNLPYFSTEDIPLDDQSLSFDEVTLPDQNNYFLDSNELNNDFQNPLQLPGYDRYNSLNQFEKPDVGAFTDFGSDKMQSSNYDRSVGAQLGDVKGLGEGSLSKLPQLSNRFDVPQFQNEHLRNNIQGDGYGGSNFQLNMNKENDNRRDLLTDDSRGFDNSELYNRPSDVDLNANRRIGKSRYSGTKDEALQSDKENLIESSNQNGNEGILNPRFTSQNYDRLNDLSLINLPNAMEQPLGKVLESLGINIKGNASGNLNLKNLHATMSPISVGTSTLAFRRTLEQPVRYVMNSNGVRQLNEGLERKRKEGSLKFSDLQMMKLRNDMRNEAMKRVEGLTLSEPRRKVIRSRNRVRDNLEELIGEERNVGGNVRGRNVSAAVNETKEVANLLLDTIIDELEELRLDHAKDNKREGLPCRISGSWLTAQAGMKLDMKIVNHSIIVTLSNLTSPHFHESLLNGTWNITGHVPFKHGAPFTLIATDNHTNTVAVFVGSCRVCHGVDTIAGVWSVARQPKDCRDFQIATSVFNDVFRKTRLSSIKEKQRSITTESTTTQNLTNSVTMGNTTLKNEKSKS